MACESGLRARTERALHLRLQRRVQTRIPMETIYRAARNLKVVLRSGIQVEMAARNPQGENVLAILVVCEVVNVCILSFSDGGLFFRPSWHRRGDVGESWASSACSLRYRRRACRSSFVRTMIYSGQILPSIKQSGRSVNQAEVGSQPNVLQQAVDPTATLVPIT